MGRSHRRSRSYSLYSFKLALILMCILMGKTVVDPINAEHTCILKRQYVGKHLQELARWPCQLAKFTNVLGISGNKVIFIILHYS